MRDSFCFYNRSAIIKMGTCSSIVTVRSRGHPGSSLCHPRYYVRVTGILPQSLLASTFAPRLAWAPTCRPTDTWELPSIAPARSPTAHALLARGSLNELLKDVPLRTPKQRSFLNPIRYVPHVLKRRAHHVLQRRAYLPRLIWRQCAASRQAAAQNRR
jgi:hypothetical protein